MPKFRNHEIDEEVLQALLSGMKPNEVIAVLPIPEPSFYTTVARLIKQNKLVRVSLGVYADPESVPSNSNGNGNHNHEVHPYMSVSPKPVLATASINPQNSPLIERDKRRITLSDFLRRRKSVTLFVEYSPFEVEGVSKFELEIGGIWFEIPIHGSLRICIGNEVPRWSPTQASYDGVTCYRITHNDGQQIEYNHDLKCPLTVDSKE